MEIGFKPIMQKMRTGVVAAGLTASTVLGGCSNEGKVQLPTYDYAFNPVTEYYQKLGQREGFVADSVAASYTRGMERDAYINTIKQLTKENINADKWFGTMKKKARPYEIASLEANRDMQKSVNKLLFDPKAIYIRPGKKDLNAVDSIVNNVLKNEQMNNLIKNVVKTIKKVK